MAVPKFLTGMEIKSVVHMHSPGFQAKVRKTASGGYELTDIIRWPLDETFPEIDPEFSKALEDAIVFLMEKATERRNNPKWMYPV
jgi:hypothetical protein